MYRYAASLQGDLCLNAYELPETRTLEYIWLGCAVIGLLCIDLAVTLPSSPVPFSGFAFLLLAAWIPWIRIRRFKSSPPTE